MPVENKNTDTFAPANAIYYYGCPHTDKYLLHDPASLPRYGCLARKAMMHYAGDRYNPHVHGLMHEPFLRGMIREIISYKILHRLPSYDWVWIDHSFRKYFSGCFDLALPFDQKRIDAGFTGAARPARQVDTSCH